MFNFKKMMPMISRAVQSFGAQRSSPASPMSRVAQAASQAASQASNAPRPPVPPGFNTMAQNVPRMVSEVAKRVSGKTFKSGGKSKKSNW